MRIELHGREEDGIARDREPVSVGIPLPRGLSRDVSALVLRDAHGVALPWQIAATERWSDGSLRWVLSDFPVSLPAHGELVRFVEVAGGTSVAPSAPPSPVLVREEDDCIVVDTGAARFRLAPGRAFPFRSVRVADREMLDPARTGLTAEDPAGVTWIAITRSLDLEAEGPIRATVRAEGGFEGAGAEPLVFLARLHFHAGSATVRLAITLRNARRAEHPGGIWELGDAGSLLLRDVSLSVAGEGLPRVAFSTAPGHPLEDARASSVSIFQDSSGGENWRSRLHVTRDGTVSTAFRGFRLRDGAEETPEGSGHRASPRVVVHDGAVGIGAAPRHFWERFPQAIEADGGADGGALTVRWFPRHAAALHELQGGEQTTRELGLSFGAEALSAGLDAIHRPLLVAPTPASFAAADALAHLVPRDAGAADRYERLVGAALGPEGFVHKRERDDVFGWRHFGEMCADHEAREWKGEGTFISHYNNQYDAVLGALHQFARTGDARWFRLMDELARHVADVDLYHTDEDKPAYNRGLFWPTVHYVDGGRSTHRTYPAGTEGGGPDNEHNYTTGLRLWWLLTGNEIGREASLDGARRTIAADDGRKTPFRWVVHGATGLASKTRDFTYHGPGRGAGNTLTALLDAWRTTGEEHWLAKCDEILRRTIHPRDDPAARNLLDVENRWSYTVHLQAVGRYLEELAEAGRCGASYAWARESLLTYARWMADHERPTLEHGDALEYPTETWPAQDLRKAEVFAYAAMHADGAERARFVERAVWFRDASLASLETFPTRTFTRPLVLLSRYGPLVDWLQRHPDAALPAPTTTTPFGTPKAFVPQRTRAIRRVRDLLGLAAVAGAGFAIARLLGT